VFQRTALLESLERPKEETSKLRVVDEPSFEAEIGAEDVRRLREARIKEQVSSLLRKMELSEKHDIHAFDQFQFEEHQMGWDNLLKMMRTRSKDGRAWKLVQRIKEVRRLYFNLINSSQSVNQQISGQLGKSGQRKAKIEAPPPNRVIRFQDEVQKPS
jgi:hypothetical protein